MVKTPKTRVRACRNREDVQRAQLEAALRRFLDEQEKPVKPAR